MNSPGSTVVRFSSIHKESPVNEVLAARANVLEMTQQAEDAVLRPAECGGWSHSLRAALAARMALQNDLADLASHYTALITDECFRPLADPQQDGAAQGLHPILAYMDRVAVQPCNVVDSDIRTLQSAGISDADIVRLTELNAFMAYQLRLVAGLKLLAEVPA